MSRLARRSRATPDSLPPRSLVASAKRMKIGSDITKAARNDEGWQTQAWMFYDTIGEFASAVNWVGNLLSRAKLYATVDTGEGPMRAEAGSKADIFVDQLFYNESGRSQMLRQMGIHYTVPGECYLIGTEKEGADDFRIVSSSRVKVRGDAFQVDGKELTSDAEGGPLVIRCWRQHPVAQGQATSPTRAALPILSEIQGLTMHVAAQIASRLSSAGILFLPNEIAFAASGAQDAEGQQAARTGANGVVDTLMKVAATAIQNRDDASALIPIVMTGDGEHLDKVHLLKFWTDLDQHAIELRTEAVRRLALAMDMPPEVLTGQGNTNHWAAWQIEESAVKAYTEPLLNQIADDLALGYLRPLLEADGMEAEEAQKFGIGVDTAEMRLRPNRSKEALELWDRGILSPSALLVETGFTPADGMTGPEYEHWMQQKVGSGSGTPEMVLAALQAMGILKGVKIGEGETTEAPSSPSLKEHPTNDPPEDEVSAALLSGAEVLVYRALERAGNRLRNKMQARPAGVTASQFYQYVPVGTGDLEFLLEDAWSTVHLFSDGWGCAPEDNPQLVECLDAYCRALLVTQKPHDRKMLASYIRLTKAGALS